MHYCFFASINLEKLKILQKKVIKVTSMEKKHVSNNYANETMQRNNEKLEDFDCERRSWENI